MSIKLERFRLSPKLFAAEYIPEPGETVVQIPDGVTDISLRLFYKKKLQGVILPDSVECIGALAFYGCCHLTQITLPPFLREIEDSAFAETGLKGIVIPDTVRKLESAFQSCEALETAVLPRSLKALEHGMFYHCKSLRSISLPEHLETIGDGAFRNAGLQTIYLPDTVRRIEESAFYDCKDLTEVRLPDGLQFIGKDAFRFTGLKTVRIPESVRKICFHAFDKGVNVEICTGGNTFIPLTLEDDWGFDEQDQFVSVRNPQDSEYAEHYSALLKRAARQLTAPKNQAKLIQLAEDKRISPELIAACIAQSAEQEILPLTARLMDTLNSEFQVNEKRFRL